MKLIDSTIAAELAPTGRLRASLNMANAVLAKSHTASEKPAGVTIDLSRELARRLGVELDLIEWSAPGESVRALATGSADVGYLAIDPARAREVFFTQPYVQIEGCYLARDESPMVDQQEVDQPGVEVLVIETSAYDLFLTRNLKHAQLIRFPDAPQVLRGLLARGTEAVAAGVRQALIADMQSAPGLRLLDGHFMAILQGMVLPPGRSEAAQQAIRAFLAEMVTDGFVAAALRRHGIEGATVLPPQNSSMASTSLAP